MQEPVNQPNFADLKIGGPPVSFAPPKRGAGGGWDLIDSLGEAKGKMGAVSSGARSVSVFKIPGSFCELIFFNYGMNSAWVLSLGGSFYPSVPAYSSKCERSEGFLSVQLGFSRRCRIGIRAAPRSGCF